ncbi:MAG: hypothetical protein LIO85_09750 [Rikenellaceae bacterium]|nr:hypothetical protein [Rikenellaceae bacterium]
MIKFRNILAAALLLVLLPLAGAQGQTYDEVRRHNPWNAGGNAAGIRMDSATVSYAEIYGRYGAGDLRESFQPDRWWNAGAVAATTVTTEKYSMAGSFRFDHLSGRNMSGSMFIHPGLYPVDVLEFTPGRKDLQTYAFTGGVSVDIAPNWRAGGSVDFSSANYSKRKDLRHTNYRLDMGVSPGVMYHNGDLALGLAYLYRKNTESIDAEEIGTSAGTYYAFLDKGLMYGAYEAWSGSGVHLSESGIDGFPVKETIHGASVQAQWGGLYADIGYRYGRGSVGEKETVWFRFPSHRLTSHIAYRPGSSHFLRVGIDWTRQVNNESVLGRETENGITITRVYGSNRIFERTELMVAPEYEYHSRRHTFIAGGWLAASERVSTLMYPYVVSQDMKRYGAYARGAVRTGCLEIKAGLSFASGNFSEKSRTVDTTVEPGEIPYHLADYYDWQNEYLTASRIGAEAALRWNIRYGIYWETGAAYTHGFDIKYIEGSHRWSGTLKIGYNF